MYLLINFRRFAVRPTGSRLSLNQRRRNEDHQLAFFLLCATLPEQAPQQRRVSQPRHLVRRIALMPLKNAAEHQGFAVFHRDLRLNLLFIDGQRFARPRLMARPGIFWLMCSVSVMRPSGNTFGVTSMPSTASLNSIAVAPLAPLETS